VMQPVIYCYSCCPKLPLEVGVQ